MLSKRLQPIASQARRTYVELMFQVMGRALQAITEVDEAARAETNQLPVGFLFEMQVMPAGPSLVVEHIGEGRLQYLGDESPSPVDLSIQFKHMAHAFLVMSFQEKTAVAFAHDRMLVDGDVSLAIKMTRVLNRLEAFILPKLIAERAVKEYPATLKLPNKLLNAARIYLKVATNLVETVRA